MRRGEWHEKARTLRKAGFTTGEIAVRCGVSYSAVYKALNPHKAHRYNARDNARPGRREAKRAADTAWRSSPEIRGVCANPCCEALRGVGSTLKRREGYCQSCYDAVAAVRRTLVEGMWADGWRTSEINVALGIAPGSPFVAVMRRRGWDLPHRRTPEQVERMKAARWAA